VNSTGGGSTDYGARVLTTHDGKVTYVNDDTKGKAGRNVNVTSPDGKFRTRYFHLKDINVKEGQEIKEGSEIGEIGGSGKGSEFGWGVHLHYQIEKYNSETGEWTPYNPTEGKEKSQSNVVDPQKWINSNRKPVQTLNKPSFFKRLLDSTIKNKPKQNKTNNT